MKVMVSRLVRIPNHGELEYAIGENGKPLAFGTVNEALRYLAERNVSLNDIVENYDFEIAEDE